MFQYLITAWPFLISLLMLYKKRVVALPCTVMPLFSA